MWLLLLIAVYFIPLRTIRANLKSFRGVKYFFTFCHLILHSIWHRGLFRTFIVSSVIGSVLFWGRIFGIWSEIAAFLDQNWLRPILMNFCIFKIVMLILGGGLSYNYVKGTDWRKGEKKEVTSWVEVIYTPDVKISKNPRIFYSFFWGGKEKRVQNLRKKSLCGDYSSMEKHFEDIPLKMRYFVILQWINFVKSTYFFILTTHKMHLILNKNINNIEIQHLMKIYIISLQN